MSQAGWTASFEFVLREFVKLDPQAPVPEHTPLVELGVDSLATVQLMLELERAIGVQLPDSKMVPETFASVRSLRSAFADVLAA